MLDDAGLENRSGNGKNASCVVITDGKPLAKNKL